jgi:hypothetical protein
MMNDAFVTADGKYVTMKAKFVCSTDAKFATTETKFVQDLIVFTYINNSDV